MSLGDLREALAQHYGLNDEVRDRLVLKHYRSQTTEGSKPKTMDVNHPPGKAIPTWEMLLVGGHSLVVRMNKGGRTRSLLLLRLGVHGARHG